MRCIIARAVEHSAGDPNDTSLPLAGFEGSPAEIERQWREQVYVGRGDRIPQLTWRAIIMGSALGGVMSLTNLYIGLKSGWGFGVAITACILSYSIWTTLCRLRIARTPMTILENVCMQSTASAAGYSTGGTLISAVAAYILVFNKSIPTLTLMAWVFFLAVLGVTMAIPMKRQMINVEQLRFPGGIAAAETLCALYSKGGQSIKSARALGIAGVLSALSTFLMEGFYLLGEKMSVMHNATWRHVGEWCLENDPARWVDRVNASVFGSSWMQRTVKFAWEHVTRP